MGKGKSSKKYSAKRQRDKKYASPIARAEDGPTLLMPGNSQLTVMKNMTNGGRIRQDVEAKIFVGQDYVNTGDHEIRDYSKDPLYSLVEAAIKESHDKDLLDLLNDTKAQIRVGDKAKTNNLLKKISQWLKTNPKFLVSTALQALSIYIDTKG